MKTIRELREEGLMSTRLYTSLIRGVGRTYHWRGKVWDGIRDLSTEEIKDLTPKDILDLYDDEEMLIIHFRGLGRKTLEELKSLA